MPSRPKAGLARRDHLWDNLAMPSGTKAGERMEQNDKHTRSLILKLFFGSLLCIKLLDSFDSRLPVAKQAEASSLRRAKHPH